MSWRSFQDSVWRALFLFFFFIFIFFWLHLMLCGERNGTPLQYSCLENPMDRGAWSAADHGVARSWTRLSNFTFTFHFHALEKEMATHSSVLAWRIPGTEEPGGLLSMGWQPLLDLTARITEANLLMFTLLTVLWVKSPLSLTPKSAVFCPWNCGGPHG